MRGHIMPMSLEEWDRGVGHHLRVISTCAKSIVVHADRMRARPDFETMAADDLAMASAILAQCLGQVQHAINSIKEKPLDD
jgi:hypothetical protein